MSASEDIHCQAFKEEARELLGELENSLLELEENPDNQDLISQVFRAMHTIKGSGAMFGFDDIANFIHNVETVFDLVRNGNIPVSNEIIDLTLQARDHITSMLNASEGVEVVDEVHGQEIIDAFKKLIPSDDNQVKVSDDSDVEPELEKKEVTYRIRFRPFIDMMQNGTDPICLINELRELGDAKVIAHTSGIPKLQFYNAEACYTSWDIILTTTSTIDDIKDVFIFVEDSCKLDISIIDDDESYDSESEYKMVGEILVEKGDLNKRDLEKVLEEQHPIGELLIKKGLVPGDKVKSALIEQEVIREKRKKRKTESEAKTIRVPSDKLDKLVDLVGELVIAQARLTQLAADQNETLIVSIAEDVEHLTRELQDNTLRIRMLPIGSTFTRFKRLVRDLSKELGKDIELETEGAETELDKTVIDRINDPLVHLIRNSIDHGIETPEQRKASGKSVKGTVRLSAYHSGAYVIIEISDDGSGLNAEKIRNRAIERGIISADTELSEKELYSLIFAPGFSTAEKVTSVSGRGVGMDVVRKSIDSLQGSIDVSSVMGKGSTIILKLPLTLAIIEGLLVKIGDEHYVAPLSVVEECVEHTHKDTAKSHGRNYTNIRGEIVPYIRLRETFKINGETPPIEQIVVVRIQDHRVGLLVDHVIGQYQTVIKNLGKIYKNFKGISGATIMGDGTVALILDIPQIVKSAEIDELSLCS